MISTLLKCLVVVLAVVVGVLIIAACGDLLCSACAHACCTRADRSGPLRRLAQWIGRACSSAAAHVLTPVATGARMLQVALEPCLSAPTLLRVASLRI
jgi:hypothetical protein